MLKISQHKDFENRKYFNHKCILGVLVSEHAYETKNNILSGENGMCCADFEMV